MERASERESEREGEGEGEMERETRRRGGDALKQNSRDLAKSAQTRIRPHQTPKVHEAPMLCSTMIYHIILYCIILVHICII